MEGFFDEMLTARNDSNTNDFRRGKWFGLIFFVPIYNKDGRLSWLL